MVNKWLKGKKMNRFAICRACGSGLDSDNQCPLCTETGEYIDPREPQGNDLRVIKGTTDVTGGLSYTLNG